MDGAYLVSACCETSQYVFMAKVSAKQGKSKVKKADSVISVVEKN